MTGRCLWLMTCIPGLRIWRRHDGGFCVADRLSACRCGVHCVWHGQAGLREIPVTLERRSEVTGREIYTDAMAEAGKKLAVQWGHAPWSDSWAQLVAKTLD